MAQIHRISVWNPLDFLSPEELARLDERFDHSLRDVPCLVFWTGVSPQIAQCWAAQHGLQTLVIAMGPLFSERGVGGARYGKDTEAWSRYMSGASGRFADYACRGRRALVLTRPPPNIYSKREWSNYRYLEEPILKGAFGEPGALQIDYIYPTNKGKATFQYQVWPLDRSSAWHTFLKTCSLKGCATCGTNEVSMLGRATGRLGTVQRLVTRSLRNKLEMAHRKVGKAAEKKARRLQAELDRQKAALKKKEVSQKREEETRAAKEARRLQAELDRQKAALKKKEVSQKREEEARVAKVARRLKAELDRQNALKKKEANRKKAEEARAAKQARRLKAELEQQKALEKKKANHKKNKELKQQKAQAGK